MQNMIAIAALTISIAMIAATFGERKLPVIILSIQLHTQRRYVPTLFFLLKNMKQLLRFKVGLET